jgi:hypothetical protein
VRPPTVSQNACAAVGGGLITRSLPFIMTYLITYRTEAQRFGRKILDGNIGKRTSSSNLT